MGDNTGALAAAADGLYAEDGGWAYGTNLGRMFESGRSGQGFRLQSASVPEVVCHLQPRGLDNRLW